jgi:C4-dicarboxylate-specific signal transduction histidine kinase
LYSPNTTGSFQRFPGRFVMTQSNPYLTAALRYFFAIVLVVAALLLSVALQKPFGNPSWFLFPAAILATTWLFGAGPGWFAVCISTLVVQYFLIPPFRTWILQPRDIPYFVTFVVCELVANRVIAWRIRTETALKEAHDQLERRVAERTADLDQANHALRNQMAEQLRTEEALQAARTELARVVRITTVGELATSIAHEVNQPLAAVVANADACVSWLTLQDPNLSEAQAAALRAVEGATRASEVIARIRSLITKGTPERLEVDINNVIEETITLTRGQMVRNDVSLSLALDARIPHVFGDRIQLQQVILNLIVNAIEAMASITERERRLEIRSQFEPHGGIRVSVQDAGVGIAEELIPRLFDPFFTTRTQGIGMGLAISHSIVEAHRGRLWAESKVNQGTLFQLTLPMQEGFTHETC